MLHSINYCMCVFLKFICIYFFLYYRGPCVRKLFTGLIMYLPSQNKEHCIVLYCIDDSWMPRMTRITGMCRMSTMTGMTEVTRMAGMTGMIRIT